MFFDIYQQHRINEVSAGLDSAKHRNQRQETEIQGMRRQLDRVTMACQGMWELIRENSDITEEMLAERIQQIDLRDGVADGKMSAQVVSCSACGRKTSARRGFCIMCGEPVSGDHIVAAG
jgi:hypothetical protein